MRMGYQYERKHDRRDLSQVRSHFHRAAFDDRRRHLAALMSGLLPGAGIMKEEASGRR